MTEDDLFQHFAGEDPNLIVEGLARRLAASTARSGPVDPDDKTYLDNLRKRWPGRYPDTIFARAGWQNLICVMSEMIDDAAPGDRIAFTQVKEKFGGLRAYHHRYDLKPVAEVVSAAGVVSERVCEWCGLPGETRRSPSGYFHTACDRHAIPGSTTAR